VFLVSFKYPETSINHLKKLSIFFSSNFKRNIPFYSSKNDPNHIFKKKKKTLEKKTFKIKRTKKDKIKKI